MFFVIEFVLSIVALLFLGLEDRRRRKYEPSMVWTNLVFKLVVAGLTAVLTIIFVLEDSNWLVQWFIDHDTEELNAICCSGIIIFGAAVAFGTFAYLAIIPDEEPNRVTD